MARALRRSLTLSKSKQKIQLLSLQNKCFPIFLERKNQNNLNQGRWNTYLTYADIFFYSWKLGTAEDVSNQYRYVTCWTRYHYHGRQNHGDFQSCALITTFTSHDAPNSHELLTGLRETTRLPMLQP